MPGWMQLHLNFKDCNNNFALDFAKGAFPQKKPEGTYKESILYLKKIVESLSGLINRYFFLFEPKPHLFLALEVKDTKGFDLIKEKIKEIKIPDFIDLAAIKFDTTDGDHPEGALDFFCASTKYAFFRVSDNYQPGYNNHDETKIIHCFCNQLFASPDNEVFFLLKSLNNRGILKSGDIVQYLKDHENQQQRNNKKITRISSREIIGDSAHNIIKIRRYRSILKRSRESAAEK